jgi:hypothetical protein
MLSNHPNCLGGNGPSASSDLIGDVDGPASATDNAVARFDGTTGKLIQNSAVTIDDSGNITPTGSVHAAAGSVGNPSLAFNVDQNTGLYNIGPNNIGVAANGSKVLDIATTGLTVTGALGASSLTSPAATNLTLAGGSSGASLVLGQGPTTASVLVTPTGVGGFLRVLKAMPSTSQFTSVGSLQLINTDTTANNWNSIDFVDSLGGGTVAGIYVKHTDHTNDYGELQFVTRGAGGLASRGIFTETGNLLIGTTSETGLTGAGGLKINSSTAGSSGAGALVVAGGISVGAGIDASSHFGGKLEITGEGSTNYGTSNPVLYLKRYTSPNGNFLVFQGRTAYTTYIGTIGTAAGIATTNDDLVIGTTGNAPTFAITASTGAATFAGAVTIGNTVNTVSPTSPNRTVTMVVNGVTLYLAAKTTND